MPNLETSDDKYIPVSELLERPIPEKELTEFYGVGPIFFWRARKRKEISFTRFGGRIYYFRADVEAFIARHKHAAARP